jgi:regulator of nucleoside diphosphate kinase
MTHCNRGTGPIGRRFVLATCVAAPRAQSGDDNRRPMVKPMINDLQTTLPAISIHARDIDRLQKLAEAAAEKYSETAEFLVREIDRANILPDHQPAHDVVAMTSEVTFRDDVTGQARTVRLVYPEDADVDAGRISILTPIGAALIGLSPQQTIAFRTPAGGWRSLTVMHVAAPSQASSCR